MGIADSNRSVNRGIEGGVVFAPAALFKQQPPPAVEGDEQLRVGLIGRGGSRFAEEILGASVEALVERTQACVDSIRSDGGVRRRESTRQQTGSD